MIVTETLESILGDVPAKPDPAKPVVFKDDPIVLSCAAYRRSIETEMAVRFPELNDCVVQPADYDLARRVRQYYQNKIAVKTLTSQRPLTQFYHDLYELLLGDVELQQRHVGMIHRLPYFYREDQDREQLRQLIQDRSLSEDWVGNAMRQLTGKETHTLRPLMKIFRSRQVAETQEYWFQNEAGQPVLWSVTNTNPLRSVVEGLFKMKQITIFAYFYIGQVKGQDFYHYYVNDVAVAGIN